MASAFLTLILPKSTTGNFKAKCINCSHDYSNSKTTMSNLLKHLMKEYPAIQISVTSINPTPVGDQCNLLGFITNVKIIIYSTNDLHTTHDLVPVFKLDSDTTEISYPH